MKTSCVTYLALLITVSLQAKIANAQVSATAGSVDDHIIYLRNSEIKVGVDLDLGGSITYLSEKEGENLINNFDWGRQIQMSFYGGPNPYMPHGKEPKPFWRSLGWNPIQSGDYAGNRAKVIGYKKSSGEIYVKCIPMQWPLDNVPCDCTFESWIRLEKNTVSVRCRLNNNRNDSTQYAGRPQELPAIYTNAPFTQLVTYRGQKPFQEDTVSRIENENIPGSGRIDWERWQGTENWAATLDKNNWGLGVWHPGVQQFTGGFFGKKGSPGNSRDKITAYVSPLSDEILDRNISYTYNYVLILGSLEQIRAYVYQHSLRDRLPAYEFSKDRQHWTYRNTIDRGWPISRYLDVKLSKDGALLGPLSFWQAKSSHYLIIRAAFKTTAKRAKVYWQLFGEKDFREMNNVEFGIRPDGKFATYKIPIGRQTGYEGGIIRLKLVPAIGGHETGGWVKIQSITIRDGRLGQRSAFAPVEGLVSRIAPGWTHRILFQTIRSDADVFELNWVNGKLVVSGNNVNSMAVGFNYYLKCYCRTDVTWYSEDKIALPAVMPELTGPIRRTATCSDRFFLNYCTYGYSMPWWSWRDWERLIDWMALNGVTMPLAITGEEAMWYNVWRKLGLSDEQVRSYFTGPTFLPWHRMANIDGWDGPLPRSWIKGQVDLQKRIVARERSFGMRPVLPAFAGHVPEALKSKFPLAKITSLGEWGGFPKKYQSSFLDPLDPLFMKIQSLFLKEQTRLFGTDHIYGADPFNEVTPPSWDPAYLATVSRTIYRSMADVDPSAVWLQMGWIFYYNRANWTDIRIDSFLTAIPKGRMELLDYFAEKKEVWKQTNSFYGQPYLWCYLGNFGGNTMLAGNLAEVESRIDDAFKNGGANLSGVGCTLEGLDMNPVMYEYVLGKAWGDEPTDVDQWIRNWAIRRCGEPDTNVEKAWELLGRKIYISPANNHASLISTRPSLKKKPRWFSDIEYHNADLLEAWSLLLSAHSKERATYRFDLVNIGRQFLENYFVGLRNRFIADYTHKDLQALLSDSSRMIGLIDDLDTLVGTQSSLLLGKWLRDAENRGKDKEEQAYFRRDARMILTTWGGQGQSLNDYANRSWAGLLGDFYAARWKMFINAVLSAVRANVPFDEKAFQAKVEAFEWRWVQEDKPFPDKPSGDAVEISERLYHKYKES